MQTDQIVLGVLAVVALVAVVYILYSSNQPSKTTTTMMASPMANKIEAFENAPADAVGMPTNTMAMPVVNAGEAMGMNEQPMGVAQPMDGMAVNQLPSECYPKDVLSSADLLPRDANSLWAQVNPSGQGSLADQNFLTAGFHIGINTVGQTLRNANRQLRSEPLNPQVKVSPWMQTTIEPDINRRPLEIEGEL